MPVDLWNVIRDFFVHFVFGGWDSSYEEFAGVVGLVWEFDSEAGEIYDGFANGAGFGLPLSGYAFGDELSFQYISFGDWLSTTATIITLCLLLFAVFLGIKFLFKLVAGSFLKIGE